VSLVVKKSELNRALNVIHGEILGLQENKYSIFGHGLVGER
jgi:aspartokinase/homoserine dehydrogenase 1